MVIVMKPGTRQEDIQALVAQLERDHGVKVGITNGVGCSILGLVGDTTHIDMDKLSMNHHVERVMRVQEPYKKANRKFHPEDTVVDVCGVPIGGGSFTVIAGPCSVVMWDITVWSAMARYPRAGLFKSWKPGTGIFTTSMSLSGATRGKWYRALNGEGKWNTCCFLKSKKKRENLSVPDRQVLPLL